jgi:hypothetical protein
MLHLAECSEGDLARLCQPFESKVADASKKDWESESTVVSKCDEYPDPNRDLDPMQSRLSSKLG